VTWREVPRKAGWVAAVGSIQSQVASFGRLTIKIEINGDSPPLPKGEIFVPMPTRWKVEQFFSWLMRWRRIAKNWCHSITGFAIDMGWCLFGLSLRRAAKLVC
jgi:transposase